MNMVVFSVNKTLHTLVSDFYLFIFCSLEKKHVIKDIYKGCVTYCSAKATLTENIS